MRLAPRLALALLVAAGAGCRRSRLAPRGDGAAVVIKSAAQEEGAPEVEPNDRAAAATLLALAGDPLSAAARGELPRGDVDLYRIAVPGGPPDGAAPADAGAEATRRLTVEVLPEGGLAVAVQLLDGASKALAASTSEAGAPDGLPNVAVLPGASYLLRLRPVESARPTRDAGTGRGYRLLVRLADFEVGDEREPNDTADRAVLLAPAETRPEAAGYFGWPRDSDWYRLPVGGLLAGSVLDAEVDGVEGVTPGLSVVGEGGIALATARGRRGDRVSVRNVRPPPADAAGAAQVYLVVKAEAGRNLERRYVLRVRPELAREGSEAEPNDREGDASAIGDGATLGFLPTGDVDLYRYRPAGPVTLQVEVAPPGRVDVKLEIVGAGDAVLARADAGKRHQPEQLAVQIGGPVLVRVSLARGEGDPDEPYQLRVATRPPDGGAPP